MAESQVSAMSRDMSVSDLKTLNRAQDAASCSENLQDPESTSIVR
jgi:hypothetical protein